MSRAEHLEWCKQRANKYVEQNDLQQAFASFQSDMTKEMGTILLLGGHLSSQHQMKEWINGFN